MKKIISVSRRTDIPAFYGDWFLERINQGFANYINPFNNKMHSVSLKLDDVYCFVFWSKNYIPFMNNLLKLNNLGYKFYFNYTINNYPDILEPDITDKEAIIENMKHLSRIYSPKYINWRYDPLLISDISDFEFHKNNFKNLAEKLSGFVERCYISYPTLYGKVRKNFKITQEKHKIKIFEPENILKIEFAESLSEIALEYGIKMYSCCSDYLLSNNISKAHCIDIKIINELFYNKLFLNNYKIKPTRTECGCTESIDIGAYDSCIHGCIYCYANSNLNKSNDYYKRHNVKRNYL